MLEQLKHVLTLVWFGWVCFGMAYYFLFDRGSVFDPFTVFFFLLFSPLIAAVLVPYFICHRIALWIVRKKKPLAKWLVERVEEGPLLARCHLFFRDGTETQVELRYVPAKMRYRLWIPRGRWKDEYSLLEAYRPLVVRAFKESLGMELNLY